MQKVEAFGQVLFGNVKANTFTEKTVWLQYHSGLSGPPGCVGIVSLAPPSEREGPYGSERHFILLPATQLKSQSLLQIILR